VVEAWQEALTPFLAKQSFVAGTVPVWAQLSSAGSRRTATASQSVAAA
jgi:hypothetical protein